MERTKYPRTFNLPHSQSNTSDDVWWEDCKLFEGKEVVVSEKIDGECISIYPDGHVHARSIDSRHHASRSWVKALAARIAHDIPQGFRVCGENLYAFHSIFYTELPSYFFVYGIYDEENNCISWDDVVEFCALLNLETVPVLYRGPWDENEVKSLWTGKGTFPTYAAISDQPSYPNDFVPCDAEGYVVRVTDSFPYQEFAQNCAKYVAPAFKSTMRNVHWASTAVICNLLKNDDI